MCNPSSNLLFALLVLIICVAGERDEQRYCFANPLETCGLVINENIIPWNLAERRQFCGSVLNYYECASEEKYPVDMLCNWPLVLHHAKDLILKFCGGSSPFLTSYMEAAKCFKDHLKRRTKECYKTVDILFRMYTQHSKKGKILARDKEVVHCIKATHRMECLAIKIQFECGYDAYKTFNVILNASKYYLLYCKDKSLHEIAQGVAAEITEGVLDNRYPLSEILL